MSKELEALERLKTAPSFMGGTSLYKGCTNSQEVLLQDYELVKQALLELKAIKEAEPNEALNITKATEKYTGINLYIIKKYILKAQKMEEDIIHYKGTVDNLRRDNALLKEIYTEYKRVLEIISEKDVDIYILKKCKKVNEYNSKIVHIIGETRELTQEEFELIKRYC